jgi:hypothetical protein
MKNRDSFRGTSIDENFAKVFKKSKFYTEIYKKHKDEVIIGVRDGFINLYYNCDSIAKIEVDNPKVCKIDSYYTNKKKDSLTEDEMVYYFDTIKTNSNKRNKKEKQAQQRLFIDNNNNPSSEWFCLDVEYTKSLKGEEHAEDWRFDIIAISKKKPFRIALVELKYGSGALKEPSGIRTHVKDFYSFFKNRSFDVLKPEIVSIIKKLDLLGVNVGDLKNIKIEDINSEAEFYFITLNNNAIPPSENTPKKTMSGYLFDDKRWGCKRVSHMVKDEGTYFNLIEEDKLFKPVFLFSNATLPELHIYDILDRKYYDEEIISV